MIPQISGAVGSSTGAEFFAGTGATGFYRRYRHQLCRQANDGHRQQRLSAAAGCGHFPRSTADVALLARVAAEPRFKSLIFTPRGGGTGTNGRAERRDYR